MFARLLVANRGEIALRVMRACAELGVSTVAVYSAADRDAPWLRSADEAHLIGPAPAAQSYLSIDKILEVAAESGAEAVHPGYGFLAENADFARAVTDAGLVWVGPSASAIAEMGDKLSARRAAEAAGVPLVPGTNEPTDDPADVQAFADEHGLPVAIKAAFGGGGRGLKVVRDSVGLVDALQAAQREAVASFGRGEVYVERYLTRPRHIEAQVLADTHGRCLFLGERDCSTQRRHQKLIEEAPAPNFPDDVRTALGEAAVRVSEQVGYTGAGTVEFLYEDGAFYFLEMNTRLQVEHPVTEIVAGMDLVHWQLRVAAGEPLRLTQDDVRLRGHAIEARINAENVGRGFVPSPGVITGWRPPSGPGVRVDAAAEAGWEVPSSYDSLVAKLVAYGADREEARRKLARALDEFVVEGVPTTIDFHRFAVEHPDFVGGNVSTVSVETEWDLSPIAAAAAATPGRGQRAPSRTLTVEVGGKRLEVAVFEPEGSDEPAPAPARPAAAQPSADRSPSPGQAPTGASAPAVEQGAPARSAEAQARASAPTTPGASGAKGAAGTLTAPMQGTIVKMAVEVGQEVAAGELVVVLEAMKMENHVTADRDGTITELHVSAGEVVNSGDAIATISAGGA
ncbi:MAG TPA: acetyl-CoA carboxylase biotin carboxylase subunit [Egibacteraceae bacterium]|nr:acetyl-CoA carboxylase biotin carboxylase subunit [Egibacteraceae bacterium]